MPCWSASEKTTSAPSKSPDFSARTPAAIFASDPGGSLSCADTGLASRSKSKGSAARLAILPSDNMDRERFTQKPANAVLVKVVTPSRLPVVGRLRKAAANRKRFADEIV